MKDFHFEEDQQGRNLITLKLIIHNLQAKISPKSLSCKCFEKYEFSASMKSWYRAGDSNPEPID